MLTLCCVRQEPIRVLAQKANQSKKPTVLVVPEQLSYEAERTLSQIGGADVCLRAEVLSFTRLAQRVASLYGGAARRTLDSAGRILAMSLAVQELHSRLKYFAAAIHRTEFLQELVQTVDELKSCCVDPQQLLHCASTLSGHSALKFEELGLILESYDAVCANIRYDPKDILTLLAQRLMEVDYADSRSFLFAGFQDFTTQQLKVIESLLRRRADVTVLLCDDMAEQSQACFAAARRTQQQLRKLAVRYSCPVQIQGVMPQFFPELEHLLQHIYSGALWPWNEGCDSLVLHMAQSTCQEGQMAADRILSLVKNGARYRDFGVALCNLDEQLPQFQQILERLNIPFYCAGTHRINLRPLPVLVLSVLEAIAFGYRRESIVDYLRSGLTTLHQQEIDALENYAIAWNVQGSRWHRVWVDHPDGYDAQMDDSARNRLMQLNDLRMRALLPLQKLEQKLRGARSLQQQTEALFHCIEDIGVNKQLEAMVKQLEASNQVQTAAEETQMYAIFVQAMEQLYTLGGSAPQEPEEFYRLVKLLLEQYEVSTIPACVDCVMIGSLEDLRCRSFTHLLVIGATEGAFPAYVQNQSLIHEEERELLLKNGIALPVLQQKLDRQILSIYNVLSGARQSLYLSCCTAEAEPSFLFRRFCFQFPTAILPVPDYYLSDFSSCERIAALLLASGSELPSQISPKLKQKLSEAMEALHIRVSYTPGRLDHDACRALYGTTLRLSPSRIDRLAACRCGYYLEYGLHLKERREFRFDAPVFGTFVHFVLEHTVREVENMGGFRQVSDEQIRELAEQNMQRFTSEHMNNLADKQERFTYLYHRNREEVFHILSSLARELRCSSFRPVGFELRFSSDGDLPAVEIPDTSVPAQIVGVVDRADLLKTDQVGYLRVVDYKTGRKSLDYTDLSIGIGLQMLIYLFSMRKTGLPGDTSALQPAGVLYFPAREPFLSAPHCPSDEELAELRRKQSRRSGLITDDEMLLHAMEDTDHEPEFLPYRNSRMGRKGDLATREQWNLLEKHVQKCLHDMVEQIYNGDVSPNPYRRGTCSSCTWCPYESVCHNEATGRDMRNYEKISASEFWEQLEKEEGEHG